MKSIAVLLLLLLLTTMRMAECQLTFQPKNHWTMQALTSSPSGSYPSSRNPADMTMDQFLDKTIGMLAMISLGMKNPGIGVADPEIPVDEARANNLINNLIRKRFPYKIRK